MTNKNDPHRYDDMVYLNRPSSPRKKMSILDRSAQFAPFAALTGHSDAILESERLTDEKIILSEEMILFINIQLQKLKEMHFPKVNITYFISDNKKNGGSYKNEDCSIKKIDELNHSIILKNQKVIKIENIVNIDFDPFNAL